MDSPRIVERHDDARQPAACPVGPPVPACACRHCRSGRRARRLRIRVVYAVVYMLCSPNVLPLDASLCLSCDALYSLTLPERRDP